MNASTGMEQMVDDWSELQSKWWKGFQSNLKRLMRKTICFSKSIQMHGIVIGMFVNRYDFGLPVQKRNIHF